MLFKSIAGRAEGRRAEGAIDTAAHALLESLQEDAAVQSAGKIIMLAGGLLVLLGLLVVLSARVPWLGRLPGDIHIQRRSFAFYFPLTTCILLSAVLSVVFWLLARR